MNFWQAIFLAIVQGLTEFLPVSSSGHLAIFQKIFHLGSPVIFDVFLHVGTLGSIIFFFRKELIQIIKGIFKKDKNYWHLFWLLAIGTIPAVMVGLFLNDKIEMIFSSLKLISLSFFITGFFLLMTFFLKEGKKQFKNTNWFDSLIIGVFQAIAILPGVSRSGSTIFGSLLRNFKKEKAFEFSFLLAIPAILGALVLQIPNLANNQFLLFVPSIFGMVVAGFVGYFSLKIFKKVLLNSRLWLFSFYCFFVSLILLIF
ncbi:MAG: undecaprenyl-diphosphate phosphatase [Candidatus Shapirobacteria bacterium]|nr:undecaprenyl-diphosphate phosphatase [Candidatus Shapirobacteria bacterium]